VQPGNLWATALFFGAVVHTFLTQRFRHWSHVLEERHRTAGPAQGSHAGMAARVLHFLGEVEAVFVIWAVPLFWLLAFRKGLPVAVGYFSDKVSYVEPVFVVVIMAIAATRPILQLAERCLGAVARLGGGRPAAWWVVILTLGPLLGSFITEPAAMTISALLLSRQFYALGPRPGLAYATLGLLFVNVSVGGALTHFAAPPVLMVAATWGWGALHMLENFGWMAAVGIAVAVGAHYLWFRRDFRQLASTAGAADAAGRTEEPVPAWITAVHVAFLAWTVVFAHHPPLLVLALLFFMAFYEVTEDYQSPLALRPAILVGLFLAGLVIHGGLQQWWIEPVLVRLGELPLFFGAMGLTAFNDNAAITYLATLVPALTDGMKHAVVAGALAGGGLTVIANAPNPAGQAILARHFPEGISPLGLLLGALLPTAVVGGCFLLLG